MLHDNTASYYPDLAAEIDTEQETIADEMGVSMKQAALIIRFRDNAVRREQAEMLAKVVGLLIRAKNLPVMVHSLAVAFGFTELNGYHSQSEIAKDLGCTRALVSHYVVGWRDVLAGKAAAFDCLKFRKRDSTREIYKEKATSSLLSTKQKIRNRKSDTPPADLDRLILKHLPT